jgi:mRNA interferase RelE/StbE
MYTVVIDELVLKKDFKKIDSSDQRRLIRAIRKKLATKPRKYGEPLSGDFAGLWKLRVGQYRIIYKVEQNRIQVYVIIVGFRRDDEVYKKLLSRLKSR